MSPMARSPICRLMRTSLAMALLLPMCSGLCPGALADAYFDGGVTYYRQKNYAKALQYFAQAYRTDPANGNAVYYQAVCRQSMGDKKGAIPLYASTVANFPGTGAANMAMSALSSLDPEYYAQLVRHRGGSAQQASSTAAASSSSNRQYAPTSSATSSIRGTSDDLSSLPSQTRIPFVREGSLLLIDAAVNGHVMKMFFDTGAEIVAMGKNQLAEVGVAEPTGAPTGAASGVGSSGSVATWMIHSNLKVGDIERRNFPICVQENMGMHPLLGQSFFRDFTYTIDYTTSGKEQGTILLIKNGSAEAQASGSHNSYGVPFTREGNELIVQVEVNGKTTPMYFDSGASTIAFSMQQCKELNIKIPDDAVTQMSRGIGGVSAAYGFTISRMRLGPIDKSNIMVSATEASRMRYPLLGQTFFGDWQYTIDNTNNVIRFVRR